MTTELIYVCLDYVVKDYIAEFIPKFYLDILYLLKNLLFITNVHEKTTRLCRVKYQFGKS